MQYSITHFDSLPSTSDEAAKTNYKSGDIVVADFQTQGRGQRGNSWVSGRGQNLLFSLVVEPQNEGVEVMVSRFFFLSEVAALATAYAVESFGVEGVELKWPNDVLVGGEKIAGVLIENSITGAHVSRSVVGVGINVLQKEFEGVRENHPTPTSLAKLGVRETTPATVLDSFATHFSRLLHTAPDELHALYMQRLYRRDGFFPYEDSATGERFTAQIVDINPGSGELTLCENGAATAQCRSYFFKEVKFL